MDQVVAAAVEQSIALHAAGKFGKVVENVVLVERSVRSSVQMDHSRAGRKLNDVGGVIFLAAGEDVDCDAAVREGATDLSHVDVESAGFPAAEGGQRAGVDAQDGELKTHRVV